jgi:hypothetical protein
VTVPAGRECYYAAHTEWRNFEHGAAQGSKYFGGLPAEIASQRFYIDCAKKLWITGTGAVPNMNNLQPWGKNNKTIGIKEVEVESGITAVGQDVVSYLPDATKITLQGSPQLGICFACDNPKLNELVINGSSMPTASGDSHFRNINKAGVTLTIPDNMVGPYATTTTDGIVWADFNIPQLVITFDANGGEW